MTKNIVAIFFLFHFGVKMFSQQTAKNYEVQDRLKWFTEARYGMFIHWGVYAIPARGEWVRTKEEISDKEYYKYLDIFNPYDLNPKKWAELARISVMKYAVLTTKYHDGFCLFDSNYTDFKSVNTKCKKDLVKEYVEAFRAAGLKVGFYYSLLDWNHPEYPIYGLHPLRNCADCKERQRDFNKYLEYMHNQVVELMTNYGKIDILWLDFSYGEMSGEKWKATELVKKIRQLQPHIIINNRLGADLHSETPVAYVGDFEGPEQYIPESSITNTSGKNIPWEACITLNNNWGYHSLDNDYKSAKDVIHTLVNCVSKNGNLLINVGPDARGNIPAKAQQILFEVGQWLQINGEAIYGCGAAPFEKPEWGRYTMRDNILYDHIYETNIGQIKLGANLNIKQSSAPVLLKDGTEAFYSKFWNGDRFPGVLLMNFGITPQFTYPLPDPINTVVKIFLED
jgi:alpha-L-fucosidase